MSKNVSMKSHILAGAVGAILTLAGSTAVDNLKCNKIEAQRITLGEEGKSVSLSALGIELRDKESGTCCLLTAKGILLNDGESPDAGGAYLRFAPDTGATLILYQKDASVTLTATDGTKRDASLRAGFADNRGGIVADREQAVLGVLDQGRTSVMNGEGVLCNLEKSLAGVFPPQSSVVGTQSVTVFVTRTGDKYHLAGCQYLRQSMIPMELSEAVKRFAPCTVCIPGGN